MDENEDSSSKEEDSRPFERMVGRLEELQTESRHGFRFLDVLGLRRDEMSHSAIIAELLDPNGDHGQGGKFLRAFLDQCANCASNNDTIPQLEERHFQDYQWHTQTEHYVPLLNQANGNRHRGFLDIAVWSPRGGVFIGIENKIDAGNQPGQIERYSNWLRRRKDRYDRQLLIYLTLDGEPAPSAHGNATYLCLSYKDDVARWLEIISSSLLRSPLQHSIQQYKRSVQELACGTGTSNADPMVRFLLKRENLEVALEVDKHMSDVKDTLLREFWKEVMDRLTRRVMEETAGNWVVESREEIRQQAFTDHYGGLRILPEGSRDVDRACVVFNLEQDRNRRLHYGLWVHPWTKKDDPALINTKPQLQRNFGGPFFDVHPYQGALVVSTSTGTTGKESLLSPDILLDLAEADENSRRTSIASDVADEFADFFQEHYELVERLNSKLS